MVLLIPYSHKDAAQALRLLKWIRFMESKKKTGLSRAKIVLVASRMASRRLIHQSIAEELKLFHNARQLVLEEEYEHGWPGSPNFMFFQSLSLLNGYDVMLLEPDAIPLWPNWWDTINQEWNEREEGQEFMGNLVPAQSGACQHMTGNGVYGKNWKAVAPKIGEVQDRTGWDVYAAHQILPRAKVTPLIQHVWKPQAVTLEMLDQDAVIFHQDKEGNLIALLDGENYGCEADRVTGYSRVFNDAKIMKRFFYADNVNRVLTANGLTFEFVPIDIFAGHLYGVYSTESENEAAGLEALAPIGVQEVDEARFLEAIEAKKKARLSPLLLEPSVPQAPPEQVNPVPAVLVEDPAKSGIRPPPLPVEPLPEIQRVKSVDDVLRISKVTPPEPAKKKPQNKKGNS